jgi:hypothetical protein
LETQKINEERRNNKEKDDEDGDSRRSGADKKLKVAGGR